MAAYSIRFVPVFTVAALVLACAGSDGTSPEPAPATEPAPSAAADPADDAESPERAFWSRIAELCGAAFEGELVEGTEPGDQELGGERLIMDAHTCEDDEIRIGFYAGDDRSRTWVLREHDDGLALSHDHREPDGTPEEITGYGGVTADEGSPGEQAFHADAHTAELVPEAATNVWTMEIEPGERFVYRLHREEGERRFRVDFDLTNPTGDPDAH